MTKQELALRLVHANGILEAMHKALDNPGDATYANHEEFKSACKYVLNRHTEDLQKIAADIFMQVLSETELEKLILIVESKDPILELATVNEFLTQEAISQLIMTVYQQTAESTPRVVPSFHNN